MQSAIFCLLSSVNYLVTNKHALQFRTSLLIVLIIIKRPRMQTTDEMIAVFIQSSVSQLDLLQIVDGIS